MRHVFVNGVHVLKDGDHTGAKPGRCPRRVEAMNYPNTPFNEMIVRPFK